MAVATRSLATLLNAQRIADRQHDADGQDWAVLETGDAGQPYTVAPYVGQGAAVSLSTSHAASARRFAQASHRQH